MGTKRKQLEAKRAEEARLKFLEEIKKAPKPVVSAPKKATPKAEEPKTAKKTVKKTVKKVVKKVAKAVEKKEEE